MLLFIIVIIVFFNNFYLNLKNFPLLSFCYELLLLKFKLLFNTMGNNNSLSSRRFEHLKKLEKSKKKKKKKKEVRIGSRDNVGVFLCLVFFVAFFQDF